MVTAYNTRTGVAHPRSRGENPSRERMGGFHAGSSPLTRGKLEDMCGVSLSQRLIPAHAGKTRPRDARFPPGQAHPRSRGENILKADLAVGD